MSYSSAMKKRYQLLKRVSIILIFFVLFTKMHAVEPQYAEPQDIQKTETNVEVEEHPQDYIVIKIPFQAKYKSLFIYIWCYAEGEILLTAVADRGSFILALWKIQWSYKYKFNDAYVCAGQ